MCSAYIDLTYDNLKKFVNDALVGVIIASVPPAAYIMWIQMKQPKPIKK